MPSLIFHICQCCIKRISPWMTFVFLFFAVEANSCSTTVSNSDDFIVSSHGWMMMMIIIKWVVNHHHQVAHYYSSLTVYFSIFKHVRGRIRLIKRLIDSQIFYTFMSQEDVNVFGKTPSNTRVLHAP